MHRAQLSAVVPELTTADYGTRERDPVNTEAKFK